MAVLSYGATAGSEDLIAAFTKFANTHFKPNVPINPSQILVTNGVSPLLDLLPFAVCDPGEAMLYTTPAYGMFKHNIEARNSIEIVEVPCPDDFDQFVAGNAETLIEMFESALKTTQAKGLVVKAVLICNPCNPLGRCYSRVSLEQIVGFCGRNNLHLISDEIYSMSVFSTLESTGKGAILDGFTSVLSLKEGDGFDSRNVHVLYGASKDWGLGGLRMGFLMTRNTLVWEAVRRLW